MNNNQKYYPHLDHLTLSVADADFLHKVDAVAYSLMRQNRVGPESVASALNIHPQKLRRRIAAITGITPSNYLMNLRMRTALQMLEHYPANSINDVADACGFVDQSHFNHTFHRFFSQSPLEYVQGQKGE